MKINDFKNFEEFLVYSNQYGDEMKNWDDEKLKTYSDKVAKLIDDSPEFKEKYEKWTKRLELQIKAKEARVKISGTAEETAYSKAYLRLKEIQKENKKSKPSQTSKTITSVKKNNIVEI